MKRLLVSLSLFFLLPLNGYGQTAGDIDRAIHNYEARHDSAFAANHDSGFAAIHQWTADSLISEMASEFYDYLIRSLPNVKGSLLYNYKCEQGVIRYATSADRKLRLWTFDESSAEAGDFSNLAEFETSNGERVKDMRDTTETVEGTVGSGGWCDTIYSIVSNSGITYYMPLMHYAADNITAGMGIDAYSIESDRLRTDLKLFRTPKKQLTNISFWYDFFKSNDQKIHLGADGKPLLIPLVNDDSITESNLRYEFDGKQFVYKKIDK